jgi:hypothetical protein
MRIPTVIVEGIPGSARHRPIENEFDPVDAGSHLPIRFDRRSKAAYLFCPFEPRSHIQQILDRDGFLSCKRRSCSLTFISGPDSFL